MNYYTRMARYSYRVAFLSAAATYGIVVYKTWRARQKTNAKQPSPIQYIADENVQYLGAFTLVAGLNRDAGPLANLVG